jgi:hypothetical protein
MSALQFDEARTLIFAKMDEIAGDPAREKRGDR